MTELAQEDRYQIAVHVMPQQLSIYLNVTSISANQYEDYLAYPVKAKLEPQVSR